MRRTTAHFRRIRFARSATQAPSWIVNRPWLPALSNLVAICHQIARALSQRPLPGLP
jgi:hypothetical protein